MKIVFVNPGVGDNFYCQNCFRDSGLLKALMQLGHDVINTPMYLPANIEYGESIRKTPIFFGAVNVYLEEKLSIYKYAPKWLKKILDSKKLLQLIASRTGSTKAAGLEEMTLSMLRGEEGRQSAELDQLIAFLLKEIQPDVVHLANALLLGLTRKLKGELKCKVVCFLQDENEWIDLMDPGYQDKVWDLMAEKAREVDLFITSSEFYAQKAGEKLKIPPEKIKVMLGGIDMTIYEDSPLPLDPPVLGYLCRMSEYFGLEIVVDAFILLKKIPEFRELRLHLSGGYAGEDKQFLKRLIKKISAHDYLGDTRIFKHFDRENRVEFLKALTLLTVPVPEGESFGAYQFEALAAGVPVVQPNVGSYPEFVEATGGGIIYEPNTSEGLAKAIQSLLSNPEKIKQIGTRGKQILKTRYSARRIAQEIVKLYQEILKP